MIFHKRKALPKPFDEQLINNFKEINRVFESKQKGSENIPFIIPFSIKQSKNFDLTRLIYLLELLTLWYEFLSSNNQELEKNNSITLNNVIESIISISPILMSMIENKRILEILEFSKIRLENGIVKKDVKNLTLDDFKIKLEKIYREIHKIVSKEIAGMRRHFL